MSNIVTVLDIGTHKTAVLVTLIEEGQTPKVIGFASMPSKGVKKGMITNIEEAMEVVANTITTAERMANVQIEEIYLTVTGSTITSHNEKGTISITGPEITHGDIIRSIEYAKTQLTPLPTGMEFLHVIPNEFAIDGHTGIKYPIGMSGSKLEVECHFILAPTSLLKNTSRIVQKLGIVDRGFVFSGWADTYSVLTETEKELGITLLDIGAGSTDIVIFKESKVIFSGSVPIGGYHITSDLAAGLGIPSLEGAEKLKLNLKSLLERPQEEKIFTKDKDAKNKPQNNDTLDISSLKIEGKDKVSRQLLWDIIEARVLDILENAEKLARSKGASLVAPGGIVLTGGTANLYNITKIIKDATKTPARIGKPKGLAGMVDEITAPEYATIQGGVLYALNESDLETYDDGFLGAGILDTIKKWIKSITG